MKAALFALVLSACELPLVDVINDPEDCCLKLTRGSVRSCVAEYLEPGHCKEWSCPTTCGAVCRSLDDEVVEPDPEYMLGCE